MRIKWIGAHERNFGEGRDENIIDLIIVHWIVGTLEAADATFQDGRRRASAHYGIGDREIHQYVDEDDTAYHAGDIDINMRSIGIECEGGPDLPITDATYETSAKLIKDVADRYGIPINKEHIRPHSDFQATECPGDLDIERLIQMALALEDDECQDKIEILEDEIIEWKQGYERKDRKLETCRIERAEYKAEIKEVREQYQTQVSELNQTNSSLLTEKKQLNERVKKLEGDILTFNSDNEKLENAVEALSKRFKDLQDKYDRCREYVNDTILKYPLWKFIWKKIVR